MKSLYTIPKLDRDSTKKETTNQYVMSLDAKSNPHNICKLITAMYKKEFCNMTKWELL